MPEINCLINDCTRYGLRRLHLVSETKIDVMPYLENLPDDAQVIQYKGGCWHAWILWKDPASPPACSFPTAPFCRRTANA